MTLSEAGDIRSLTKEEMQDLLLAMGEKRFRADQLYEWLHRRLAGDYSEMTILSKALREKLAEAMPLYTLKAETVQISSEDGTRKYLFRLHDGLFVESVLMRYEYGLSACISSQVGCGMGCAFCASAIGGKVRDLSAGEMLDQVYRMQKDAGERISHVVVMGTGEPLDNYEALVRFIRLISDEEGLCIGQRNLTVSTCGIVPNMRKLADEGLQITLALSLHAATQEKRERLMPAARKYALTEVLAACDDYFKKTGRRITYEYALIDGVNNTKEDISELIRLFGGQNCHLNLIPLNPVRERKFFGPEKKDVTAFCRALADGGVHATIRRSMGRDIDGACGQLRRRKEEGTATT